VDWNTRRELDIKIAELQESLSSMMASEPPHPAGDIIAFVKGRKQEQVRGRGALLTERAVFVQLALAAGCATFPCGWCSKCTLVKGVGWPSMGNGVDVLVVVLVGPLVGLSLLGGGLGWSCLWPDGSLLVVVWSAVATLCSCNKGCFFWTVASYLLLVSLTLAAFAAFVAFAVLCCAVLCCSLSCGVLQNLPDSDVVRVLWICIMNSINMTGKNQTQILQTIITKVKTYHKLLQSFVTNAKLELTLLVTLQVWHQSLSGSINLDPAQQAVVLFPPVRQPPPPAALGNLRLDWAAS